MTTMTCEKCHEGQMERAREPRFSPSLRLIGYLCLLGALASILVPPAACLNTRAEQREALREAQRSISGKYADQLLDLPTLSRDDVEHFRSTGEIDRTRMLSTLPDRDRAQAARILAEYDSAVAVFRDSAETSSTAGEILVTVGLLFAVALLVPGLLLTRRQNVWLCPRCGYYFARV